MSARSAPPRSWVKLRPTGMLGTGSGAGEGARLLPDLHTMTLCIGVSQAWPLPSAHVHAGTQDVCMFPESSLAQNVYHHALVEASRLHACSPLAGCRPCIPHAERPWPIIGRVCAQHGPCARALGSLSPSTNTQKQRERWAWRTWGRAPAGSWCPRWVLQMRVQS